jgi:RpiR family carbohydrate utilization transcriptional regulator
MVRDKTGADTSGTRARPRPTVLLRNAYAALNPAEQRIADYVMAKPTEAIYLTITELAERTEVSESTVVRLCQSLGLRGYQEFRILLSQEVAGNSFEPVHERIELSDGIDTVVGKVFQISGRVLEETRTMLHTDALERAAEALAKARVIQFCATGNSLSGAQDAAYRFMRIGKLSVCYLDPTLQAVAARLLTRADVAIGISYSGSSKSTVGALGLAHEAGATTICITNHRRSPINEVADIGLYMSAQGTPFQEEAMSTRITQLAVMDTLFVLTALRMPDLALESIRITEALLTDTKY